MPKIRTLRTRRPPPGWDLIEPTLSEFARKIQEVHNEPTEAKRRTETMWPLMRLIHQRSRYIFELYYRQHEISRELYEYCLAEKYADAPLIAKWKKPGYERLCCLLCIETSAHNFGTTCVCRVPKDKLEEGKVVECRHCGCRGCASGD